jgi:Ca2+-binding EF-hand superfamily protein
LSASQLKSTDRNKDGKITAEEIPKLLRESILGRVDTNKDGEIDEAELDALAKQQAEQK